VVILLMAKVLLGDATAPASATAIASRTPGRFVKSAYQIAYGKQKQQPNKNILNSDRVHIMNDLPVFLF